MPEVVQPQRAPALSAGNLRCGQDHVEGVTQGREGVRLARRRREERLAWCPLAEFVRDRIPTVRESSRDVGGHGHESGFAEPGVANAEHRGLQIDVRQGEAKALAGPQPREVQQDQQRPEDEPAPRRVAGAVEGVAGVEKAAAFIQRKDTRYDSAALDTEESGRWHERARVVECEEATHFPDERQPMRSRGLRLGPRAGLRRRARCRW